MLPENTPAKKICFIEGCGRIQAALGLCQSHRRQEIAGEPFREIRKVNQKPSERFLTYVEKTETCWKWTGGLTSLGYGKFSLNRRLVSAHRFSYENSVGPIPEGLFVDHICFNKSCVNPDHLRLVTRKQNGEHRRGASSNSKSGIRGVYWHPKQKRWRASVTHEGKLIHLPEFTSIEDAEKAVIELRNKLFTHNDLDRI